MLNKLCLLLFFIPGISGAQVVLNNDSDQMLVGKSTFYLEDKSGLLTIDDVLSPEYQSKFLRQERAAPNFGNKQTHYWNKIVVVNNSDKEWVFVVDNYSLDTLDLYYVDESGVIGNVRQGRLFSFNEKKYKSNTFAFDLPIETNDTVVLYLRVSSYIMQFPLIVTTKEKFIETNYERNVFQGVLLGFLLMIILYNLFFYLTVKDRNYFYFVIYVFFTILMISEFKGYTAILWNGPLEFMRGHAPFITALVGVFSLIYSRNVLETKKYMPRFDFYFAIFFNSVCVIVMILDLFDYKLYASIMNQTFVFALFFSMYIMAIYIYRKGYFPALYYIIGSTLFFIIACLYVFYLTGIMPYSRFTENMLSIGSASEMLLFSLTLAAKVKIYKEEKERAQNELVATLQENEKLILEQKEVLEIKVKERTSELEETLDHLKTTQDQLVQQEKLASLGQLTAGVAHEMQNPLNFVNNFSEITTELIDEYNETSDLNEKELILNDIKSNLVKINEHGKRAGSIVKSMLHVSKTEQQQLTKGDPHSVCEDALILATQSVKSKYNALKFEVQTNYTKASPQVMMMPNDLTRVFLNLFTNAFYALEDKRKKLGPDYNPVLEITSETQSSQLFFRIKDNGVGIPQDAIKKIFEPFYTTKPTGEGTGLGLSICFDTMKAHKGDLQVESVAGESTTFILSLPVS
jgi:signal transduction histidine kinase